MGIPLRNNSFCEFSHTRSTYNLLELSTHNFILIILGLESVHTLSKKYATARQRHTGMDLSVCVQKDHGHRPSRSPWPSQRPSGRRQWKG